MCLYVLYKTCAGVNIDPVGQTFEKKKKKKKTGFENKMYFFKASSFVASFKPSLLLQVKTTPQLISGFISFFK